MIPIDLTCAFLQFAVPHLANNEDRLHRVRALLSIIWFILARSVATLFLPSTSCSIRLGFCLFADALLVATLLYMICLKANFFAAHALGSLFVYKMVTVVGALRLIDILCSVVISESCPLRLLCVEMFAVVVNIEIFSISFDLLEMVFISLRWCCWSLFEDGVQLPETNDSDDSVEEKDEKVLIEMSHITGIDMDQLVSELDLHTPDSVTSSEQEKEDKPNEVGDTKKTTNDKVERCV